MDEKAWTSMSKFSKLQDNMYELDTDQDYADWYGDVEHMEHEANANTNFKSFISLIFLMIAIVLSAATCAYEVYHFSAMLALYCIIMLLAGFFFVDILFTWTFYCFIISLFLWCKQKRA